MTEKGKLNKKTEVPILKKQMKIADIKVTDVAETLGIPRSTASGQINGDYPITKGLYTLLGTLITSGFQELGLNNVELLWEKS